MRNYLFDFDGTLADSGDAAVLATQDCFRNFDLEVPSAKTVRYYMGVPIETYIPELVEKQGKHFTDKQFNEMYDNFRKHYTEIEMQTTKLYDGIENALQTLKKQGKHLFVVSSKHTTSLERNLKQLNILDLFDDCIGSDQVKNYKPAPDGILMLLEHYQLDPDETVMIGDAKYDIQMGKAAHVKTCGCLWDTFDAEMLKKEHPDYLIDVPDKLKNM